MKRFRSSRSIWDRWFVASDVGMSFQKSGVDEAACDKSEAIRGLGMPVNL